MAASYGGPTPFFRATTGTVKRVIAIVILSVRLSVCHDSRPCTYSSLGEIEYRLLVLPYDSLESLVSCEQISCRCMRRFPSNEGIKEGYHLEKSLFYHH